MQKGQRERNAEGKLATYISTRREWYPSASEAQLQELSDLKHRELTAHSEEDAERCRYLLNQLEQTLGQYELEGDSDPQYREMQEMIRKGGFAALRDEPQTTLEVAADLGFQILGPPTKD